MEDRGQGRGDISCGEGGEAALLLACENGRFSSHLAAGDVSQGGC